MGVGGESVAFRRLSREGQRDLEGPGTAGWDCYPNSLRTHRFPFIFICFCQGKVSKSKGQGKVYMRLGGVVRSPSVKTFICWWLHALGELRRLQREDPVHPGQVMMEGSRQVQGNSEQSPPALLEHLQRKGLLFVPSFFFFCSPE